MSVDRSVDRADGPVRQVVVERREARVGRVASVLDVRKAVDLLPVVGAAQPVPRIQVEVQARGRQVFHALARALVDVGLAIELVGLHADGAGRQRGPARVCDQPLNDWIERRRVAGPRRDVHHVHRPRLPADHVRVGALRRIRVEERPRARRFRRLIELFVVEEEERLAAPVEHIGNVDRPAEAAARLVQDDAVLVEVVLFVDPGVRVERRMTHVVVERAAVRIGARAGDEADLDRPLAGALGALRRRGQRHLFDRVELWPDHRVEAVPGPVLVVVHVHAVERDVDRLLRQAGDARVAHGAGGVDAGEQVHRIQRVARRQRDGLELLGHQRRAHGAALRLDQLGSAADFDRLGQRADLERDFDLRRTRGDEPLVVDHRSLEA